MLFCDYSCLDLSFGYVISFLHMMSDLLLHFSPHSPICTFPRSFVAFCDEISLACHITQDRFQLVTTLTGFYHIISVSVWNLILGSWFLLLLVFFPLVSVSKNSDTDYLVIAFSLKKYMMFSLASLVRDNQEGNAIDII